MVVRPNDQVEHEEPGAQEPGSLDRVGRLPHGLRSVSPGSPDQMTMVPGREELSYSTAWSCYM